MFVGGVVGGHRTLAKSDDQMGSTSTLAALIRVVSLSAYFEKNVRVSKFDGPSICRCPLPCDSNMRPQVWVGGFPYGDLNAIIGEDQSRVRGCQLSVGHCDLCNSGENGRKMSRSASLLVFTMW